MINTRFNTWDKCRRQLALLAAADKQIPAAWAAHTSETLQTFRRVIMDGQPCHPDIAIRTLTFLEDATRNGVIDDEYGAEPHKAMAAVGVDIPLMSGFHRKSIPILVAWIDMETYERIKAIAGRKRNPAHVLESAISWAIIKWGEKKTPRADNPGERVANQTK